MLGKIPFLPKESSVWPLKSWTGELYPTNHSSVFTRAAWYIVTLVWACNVLIERRLLTHLWHLDFPDDQLGAQGGSVVTGAFPCTHGAATVYWVHAVHIGAWVDRRAKPWACTHVYVCTVWVCSANWLQLFILPPRGHVSPTQPLLFINTCHYPQGEVRWATSRLLWLRSDTSSAI